MTAEPSPTAAPHPLPLVVTAEGQRATLTFSGALEARMVRELEERLADPQLRQTREWLLEMSALTRLDLACAYALLRAATTFPEPVTLHVRGARRAVQRTLRDAGVDAVATIDE
ncbi:STAS domain-containing protein [Streptomyces sp. NPDC050988]|uniref:STAS domain-containing protein n=1 Tax=Streptomyces sp. NPDC050988 TaxID=3365637 RepID=UPI0037B63040